MKNSNKNYVLIAVLLQSAFIVMLNTAILNADSLENLKRNIPIYNIAIIIISILIVVSLIKIRDYESKAHEHKETKKNLKAIEELLILLRTERHEYLTNIQSIEALIYLEEYKELTDYVRGLSSNYRVNSEIIRIGNPALSALVNTKREEAKEKGIDFYINSKIKIEIVQLNIWELCSIFSNLLQNAIDACETVTDKKWIRLSIVRDTNNYTVKFENSGQISLDVIDKILKAGITTKNSKARGYGLYICNTILNNYKGTMKYENTIKNTVIFTVEIPREEQYIDTKIV